MDHLVNPMKLTTVRGGTDDSDRLLAEWLPAVVRWCSHLGGASVDPEDAAHDVFIVALRRMDHLYDPSHTAAWLFGITRRVLAQHRRRAWVRRWVPGMSVERPDPARGPAALVSMSQTSERVRSVLDQLPLAERQVLLLCLVEERSDREVAEMLDIPHGTVKSRMRRARARFLAVAERAGLALEDE
ncbi:MAG: sigma-70 family RNA polymerase sigma factor [Pseudomonadota bacterium]|nr:sigma-70 family RNA polymerase sigma factor [Pseudomonadota bacterium]